MNGANIVQKYYDCFNSKDWQGMLNLLSDDVIHVPNQSQPEKGKEAFKRFMEVMDEHYSEQLDEFCIMSNANNRRISAEFRCRGKFLKAQANMPEANGQTYSIPVGAFFEINPEGKICRITNYYNMNDWLKQVSVS